MASLSFPMLDDLQGKVQNKPALIEWEARRRQSTWHNRPVQGHVSGLPISNASNTGTMGPIAATGSSPDHHQALSNFQRTFRLLPSCCKNRYPSGCEPSSQQRNGNGSRCDCALLMGRLLACRKPGCFGNGSRPF